jgi:hypothetical protein
MEWLVSRMKPASPLQLRGLGGIEVLDVEECGHASVLILGFDTEEADLQTIGDLVSAQEMPPAERQEASVHLLQDLVGVDQRERHRGRLSFPFSGHESTGREDELEVECPGVQVLLRDGTKPQFSDQDEL